MPQKVMVMANEIFRSRSGVGVNTRVIVCTPLRSLFAVPADARNLKEVLRRRGSEVRFGWNLKEVRGEERIAVSSVRDGEGNVSLLEQSFAMLHAVPPMSAPEVVTRSPLADGDVGGWAAADPHTLQHPLFAKVFAHGDVAGLPTSKTAGAVREEAPVVAANLLAHLEGRPLEARSNGSTVCPLITGFGSVVMAETAYSQNPVSTRLVDPTRKRGSLWLLKTRPLPWLYWNRMLPGHPHEGRLLRPLAPQVHALGLDHRPRPAMTIRRPHSARAAVTEPRPQADCNCLRWASSR